jgi:hypothetical protein
MKILVLNKLIMLVGLLLLSALFSTSAIAEVSSDQSVNELSFGVTVSANGSLTSASGMHTALPFNLGTNVKKGTLNDNTVSNKDYALSVDYYRKINDNIYFNAGITESSMKTKDTKATFEGGYVVTPFPTFTTKGVTLNLGPSYRFDTSSSFTPYIGLNVSYFSGKVTNTNYPTVSGTGTYGVGGPETKATCWGLNPNLGMYANSGLLKGFGVSAKSQNLDCDGDSFRSFTQGYKTEFKNILYSVDYRVFF